MAVAELLKTSSQSCVCWSAACCPQSQSFLQPPFGVGLGQGGGHDHRWGELHRVASFNRGPAREDQVRFDDPAASSREGCEGRPKGGPKDRSEAAPAAARPPARSTVNWLPLATSAGRGGTPTFFKTLRL
jgi:hypothetical protein